MHNCIILCRNNKNNLCKYNILPMLFKPASAQQISSVYQSIAKEFGNLTFGPWTKTSLWLPSKFDHSILGLFLFQSDQNNFLTI